MNYFEEQKKEDDFRRENMIFIKEQQKIMIEEQQKNGVLLAKIEELTKKLDLEKINQELIKSTVILIETTSKSKKSIENFSEGLENKTQESLSNFFRNRKIYLLYIPLTLFLLSFLLITYLYFVQMRAMDTKIDYFAQTIYDLIKKQK